MKLEQLMDLELLKKHIFEGAVSKMSHPMYPNLVIYNYTHVAQHDNVWDDVTEQCRGLIVDSNTGEVLARPFRKFFNLNTSFRPETLEANLPSWKPRVLEKLDGSLGILYKDGDGKSAIATRGSFASDQAKWATAWYRDHNLQAPHMWPEGYTPLFEIIYKENRIVVNYEFEGLVLLGLVSLETGFEASPEEVAHYGNLNGLRVPREHRGLTLQECQAYAKPNEEGFVLQYWSNKAPIPLRVKVKTADYVRLHKIITGLNPKGVWEHLSMGYDPEALWHPAIGNQPFVDWCMDWIAQFQKMYGNLEREVTQALGRVAIISLQKQSTAETKLDARATRKVWALAIQQEPPHLQSILFACLSGGDWKKETWKLLEPKIQGKEAYIRDADKFNGL